MLPFEHLLALHKRTGQQVSTGKLVLAVHSNAAQNCLKMEAVPASVRDGWIQEYGPQWNESEAPAEATMWGGTLNT